MRLLTTGPLRNLVIPLPLPLPLPRRPDWPRFALARNLFRAFSSGQSSRSQPAATATCAEETFHVPVGGSGDISLSVVQSVAAREESRLRSIRPNVILYLPSGPLFRGLKGGHHVDSSGGSLSYRSNDNGTDTLTPQQVLATTTSSTVVTVNYRLGETNPARTEQQTKSPSPSPPPPKPNNSNYNEEKKNTQIHKFPIPVHDTLAGFDWIQENLQPSHLGIFGTHIGGSLALTLALTEAHSINAVSALDPICDWVSLDEYCTLSIPLRRKDEPETGNGNDTTTARSREMIVPPGGKRGATPPDLVPLLEARERFFHSPERYFDAFASPALFLRAAGRNVPFAFPKCRSGVPGFSVPVLEFPEIPARLRDSLGILMQLEELRKERNEQDGKQGGNSTGKTDDDDDGDDAGNLVRHRKRLSRWPPHGLDYGRSDPGGSAPVPVTLPWVRLYARSNRHSHHRQSPGSSRGGETVLAQQAAEMVSVMQKACFWGRERGFAQDRVQMVSVESGSGDAVERDVGGWFKDVFGREDGEGSDDTL